MFLELVAAVKFEFHWSDFSTDNDSMNEKAQCAMQNAVFVDPVGHQGFWHF